MVFPCFDAWSDSPWTMERLWHKQHAMYQHWVLQQTVPILVVHLLPLMPRNYHCCFDTFNIFSFRPLCVFIRTAFDWVPLCWQTVWVMLCDGGRPNRTAFTGCKKWCRSIWSRSILSCCWHAWTRSIEVVGLLLLRCQVSQDNWEGKIDVAVNWRQFKLIETWYVCM